MSRVALLGISAHVAPYWPDGYYGPSRPICLVTRHPTCYYKYFAFFSVNHLLGIHNGFEFSFIGCKLEVIKHHRTSSCC